MTDRISSILPEPPNGTKVMLIDNWREGAPHLVWRSDGDGEFRGQRDDERWFDERTWDDGDALSWEEITKYSTSATIVPAMPTAQAAL
jgi:hypothetical protein